MDVVRLVGVVLDVVIAVVSVWAWLQIVYGSGGHLSHAGLASLQYFTVLSNLFSGLVSAAFVLVSIAGGSIPSWLLVAKLAASSAVMVTFLTVVVLLGPTYGYKAMYQGGNFWLHLVLPLLAALGCCLFIPVGELGFSKTVWAIAPVVVYGIWYLARVLACKDEEERKKRDFYGFFRWGVAKVPLVLVVMLLGSWGLGLGLWFGSRLLCLV